MKSDSPKDGDKSFASLPTESKNLRRIDSADCGAVVVVGFAGIVAEDGDRSLRSPTQEGKRRSSEKEGQN